MAEEVQNFKVYNPLKQRSILTGKHHEIRHYSYNLPVCHTTIRKLELIYMANI